MFIDHDRSVCNKVGCRLALTGIHLKLLKSV